MKIKDLESIIEAFLPKLHRFSTIISPDLNIGREILLDAYTTTILREKKMIQEESLNDSEDRIFFRDYFFIRILTEMTSLAFKKEKGINLLLLKSVKPQYRDFYCLTLKERMMLFLEKEFSFTQQKIAEVFNVKKHEVVEQLFFAKKNILKQGGNVNETRAPF